jgi:hypothetical protein
MIQGFCFSLPTALYYKSGQLRTITLNLFIQEVHPLCLMQTTIRCCGMQQPVLQVLQKLLI